MDPRLAIIERRLAPIDRILATSGGKGGIGKSLVAATLALDLAQRGFRVGLLDLDFTGPCAHIVLGAKTELPAEDFGILAPVAHGIHFMSIAHFTGARPVPLRGEALSNALVELLAITRWSDLDFLIIDMPPGLGDIKLDAARLIPRAEYLLITTASRLALETVERALVLLSQLDLRVAGLVENMSRQPSTAVADLAAAYAIPHLGELPFDPAIEDALGQVQKMATTNFSRALHAVSQQLIGDV